MSVLLTGTKIAATEWTTYICYHEDIMYSMVGNQTYLRPVAYYECLSFSLETQAYSIMNRLIEYNSVFDYEKLENKEGGNLQVYLKAKMLSDVECQALIATMLMHGFEYVTIVYAGGKQHKYSKKDINIPFFLPVYFDDQSSSNDRFIQNACEMIQIAYEDVRRKRATTTAEYYNIKYSIITN